MTDPKSSKLMTHATGTPVADNVNIQTAGPRGPALLQDLWLIEKLAHFDREVIPERRMHAKGGGAFGTFTVTHDITRFTKAKIFAQIGKVTPMFARFSTVAGERGAVDAERDIRGFSLRATGDVARHIKERHIANCAKADPAYGAGVARSLGLDEQRALQRWDAQLIAFFGPLDPLPGIHRLRVPRNGHSALSLRANSTQSEDLHEFGSSEPTCCKRIRNFSSYRRADFNKQVGRRSETSPGAHVVTSCPSGFYVGCGRLVQYVGDDRCH